MKQKIALWIGLSALLTVALSIISVVTDSWIIIINDRVLLENNEVGFNSRPQGLWLKEVTPSLLSVQSLMLAGILSIVAGAFYCLVMGLGKHNKPAIAVIIFVIAGLCFGIALVVFSVLTSDTTFTRFSRFFYGYSYFIGWFSVLFAFMLAMTTARFH